MSSSAAGVRTGARSAEREGLHDDAGPSVAAQLGHDAGATPLLERAGMNTPPDPSPVGTAIAESHLRFADAAARRDAGAMASVYAHDADFIPPNAGPLRGTVAIRDFWHGGLEMGITGLQLETVRLDQAEGIACEIGRYTLIFKSMDGAPVTDEATYLVVHKRQEDGSWRRASEIFTWSTPLQWEAKQDFAMELG
jgi:uncharacterized protein (TIGR02246 family)